MRSWSKGGLIFFILGTIFSGITGFTYYLGFGRESILRTIVEYATIMFRPVESALFDLNLRWGLIPPLVEFPFITLIIGIILGSIIGLIKSRQPQYVDSAPYEQA